MALVLVIVTALLSFACVMILILFLFRRYRGDIDAEHFEQGIESKLVRGGDPLLKSRVAIVSVMYQPVDIALWLKHHRELGIVRFYVRLEDSPAYIEYLSGMDDVIIEVGAKDRKGKNYFTLMDRQKKFVDACIDHAANHNVDFVISMDSDELLNGSLTFLDTLEDEIMCFHLANAEAVYDGTEENCFSSTSFRECSIESKCRSYINGKGGGRAEAKVAQAGPHYFSYDGAVVGSHSVEVPFEKLCILHFDSCTFAVWSSKFMSLSTGKSSSKGSGKNDFPDIPFQYYNESIDAASKAFEVYKKHTMIDPNDDDDDDIVNIEHYVDDDDDYVPKKRVKEEAMVAVITNGEFVPVVMDASMKVKCINIDDKIDRWAAIQKAYATSDMSEYFQLDRFSAVLGSRIDVESPGSILTPNARDQLHDVETLGYRTHHHQLTRGAIGCFVSHWMVYKELVEEIDDDAIYLVLEDDAFPGPNLLAMMKQIRAPKDWDIVLLGTHRVFSSSVSKDLLKVEGFWGTYAYIINKRGAHKCIDEFERNLIDVQIDSKLSWMTRPHKDAVLLNVYATKTHVVKTNPMFYDESDIQMPIKETPDSYYYDGIKLLS